MSWLESEEEAYLLPGKVLVSARPITISTLLGSCVSVCIWDEPAGVGGMNHYQLPESAVPGERSPRFGNVAIKALVEKMTALGARPETMRAKIFGGGRIIKSLNHAEHLGRRNVEMAEKMLDGYGIRVIASDVGGDQGRRLSFCTAGGQAFIRYVEGESK